jgi:hypothetical protein
MATEPWIVVPLVLTVGEKDYAVQPLDFKLGLSLKVIAEGDSKDITEDSSDEAMFKLVMGGTWDVMLEDRCPYAAMFRAGMASMQYQMALLNGVDSEHAVGIGEGVWESGIDPEILAALDRRERPRYGPLRKLRHPARAPREHPRRRNR